MIELMEEEKYQKKRKLKERTVSRTWETAMKL